MKKGVFRKEFAFAIVLLFVGASAVSALNSKLLHNGSIENTNEILVRGHIAYLCVSYDPSGEYPIGIYQFDLDDTGNLTLMYGGWFTGGDFDDIGNLYFCEYIGGLYMLDFETGQVTYIGSTIPLNGLTHDTTTDIWYGCSSYSIYIIDINTGASTLVGDTGMLNTPIGLACDNDGNIYTYDVLWSGNSHLYSIDKDTGYASVIGDMGYGFVYGQDPAYDRDDSILYIAGYFNDGSPSGLLTCDTQTGACTIVGYFPGGVEVDGFAIPYNSSNQHPHPDFTWSPSDPLPGDIILFDASASYDPDGYITLYEWDWDDDGVYEESHTTSTATHSWVSPGSYKVILRITDNLSLTGKKSKTVEVINQPPEPPIINGPTNGTVNVAYTFAIGPITDPDGDSMYYKWDWGDGNITEWLGPYASGQTISASHLWTAPGVYEIKAKLKDTYGAESNWSEPHIITIVENQPPEKPIIKGPVVGKVGIAYNFTVVITEPEAEMFFFRIDWGDGNTTGWFGPYDSGEEVTFFHTWKNVGTYSIQVKAKDMYGEESNSDLFVIQIVELKKSFLIGVFHNQSKTDDLRIIDANFLIIVPSDSIMYFGVSIVIAKNYRFGILLSSLVGGFFEAALLNK